MLAPTEEQTAALEAFKKGDHLALQAGAGTGKTTTLTLLAAHGAEQGRQGRYLAFNKTIATAAASVFPRNVQCRTAHSLAYAAVGHRYRTRLNSPRAPLWRIGEELGITRTTRIGTRDVGPRALSHTVLQALTRFCHSADPEPAHHHVPPLRGIDTDEDRTHLADLALPYARKAWDDLQNPHGGVVRFDHDHYLKIWALTEPTIPADFLLLDEAQDTNPVLEAVLHHQRPHTQIVVVGDSAQAIYGWRGARDIMTGFTGTHLNLSQSFRFGPALAREANRWLALSGAALRLAGTPDIPTRLGPSHPTATVLCRTNIGAMREVLHHLDARLRVALTGGGGALHALAQAARDLKAGKPTTHPELLLFRNWGELQDYAENDPSGRDLAPLVTLVDDHGTDAILNAVAQLTPEPNADITISTAHKAKGREWPRVRIAEDFLPPADSEDRTDAHGNPLPGPIDASEARLSYVAITRARHHLDLGGLSWINTHPDGSPAL
ncbi:UvrD-helicase domain-containing protein [Streptomyces sp. NPDC059740]|uniref:UvrD-helicase domain-containing protein n=1 Tax=Streptomyces sp. NPDC059740 TaxID=3346926 RepID=UPI0036569306